MSPPEHDARGAAWSRAMTAILGGAVIVTAVEALVVASSAAALRGAREWVGFVVLEIALGLCAAGLAALAATPLVVACVRVAAERRALVLALLATPAAAYVAHAAFRGPRAHALPGRWLVEVLVGGALVGAVWAVSRLVTRAMHAERSGPRRLLVVAASLGVVALVLVDARVLPRLYPFFHRGVEIVALGSASLLVSLLGLRDRALRRVAMGSLLVTTTIAGAAGAFALLGHERAAAAVVLDRAPLGGSLARLLLAARRARATPPSTSLVPDGPMLPPGPTLGPRDVVLITIDALRADRVVPAIAPRIAALADRGVRFERAYTQVPHTSFAIATLLTGRQVYALSAAGLAAASRETLAEVLGRERWKTAAFFPPAVFFIDRERLAPFQRSAYGFEYVKYEYLDAARRTDQVVAYFEHERPARAFVWAHFFEPHEPYELQPGFTAGTPGGPPPEPTRPEAQVRYEGEVRRVDAEVGRLLDWLSIHRPGTLVLVCADHGEEFGEHGGRYHGTTLFEEQVRVPLVVAVVGGDAQLAARRVSTPVGLVDVAPTVLTLLGLVEPPTMRGRDLSPWMAEAPRSESRGPVFVELDHRRAVVEGAYKLTCDLEVDRCALYDLAVDPGEQRDISEDHPDVEARLRAMLERASSADGEASDVSPEVVRLFERVRVGETVAAPALVASLGALPPKRRTEALRLLAALPRASGRPALDGDDDEQRTLLDLLRARDGDASARARLAQRLAAPAPWLDPVLAARLALACDDRPTVARLVQQLDGEAIVVELAEALAQTRDPRYREALQAALAPVRSRAKVADAIAELGDPAALDSLLAALPRDPYVHVRVAMIRAAARLARSPADRARARAVFAALLATEAEPPVLRALAEALGAGTWGRVEVRTLVGEVALPPDTRRRVLLAGGAIAGLALTDGAIILPPTAVRFAAPPATWLVARPSEPSPP